MDTNATLTNVMTNTTITMENIKAELLKEAFNVLQATKIGMLKGFDYLSAQIPDVIKQFLNWELAVGILFFTFGVFLVTLSIFWYKKIDNKCNESDKYKKVMGGCQWFIGISGCFIGGLFITINLFKIIQIWIAPKIFLIKYILSNIK